MHYNILNKQGYVIGQAIVMGNYSYYCINKISDCAQEISTDELFEKYNLELQ